MAIYLFSSLVVCLAILFATDATPNNKFAPENLQGEKDENRFCFVCETIVNIAKYANPKDINTLHTLLVEECNNAQGFFNDTAGCMQIFENGTNLQTIFDMIKQHVHAHAICRAINECAPAKDNMNNKDHIDIIRCEQCKSASRSFKTLSKSELSEKLKSFCWTSTDAECLDMIEKGIDLMYEYFKGDGKTDAACYNLNIC